MDSPALGELKAKKKFYEKMCEGYCGFNAIGGDFLVWMCERPN